MFADCFIYEVKLKKQKRIRQVFDKQDEIKIRTKFPLFILGKADGLIYLVLSDRKIEYPHLTKFLNGTDKRKVPESKKLPYHIGFDITNSSILIDIAEQPHILLGGSTRSGKTVGLKALITSICYWKSPTDMNFVLIDLGANDL